MRKGSGNQPFNTFEGSGRYGMWQDNSGRPSGKPKPVPVSTQGCNAALPGHSEQRVGVQASNLQPRSIEEAIDKIRLFQHNTPAIYGKPNRREVRQVMSGRYEHHAEAYHEYPVPHVRATMAPERAPARAWKAELEKTDMKFVQVHEKLDDIMDQFKKLLTRSVARSPSPGG
ncbi:unnamed protein product [Mytilus coruscus]|uniref:Uncharacterized protein n=1 Tax=Mytilus coruscus TaxID=42192 RepID=A0A6J8EXB0_MYTCO|nr:unnamed protein product [Mytilus coruscus]